MDAMSPDSTVFRSRALFISYSESEKIYTRPYRWPLFLASQPKLATKMMEMEGFGGDAGFDDGGNGAEGTAGGGNGAEGAEDTGSEGNGTEGTEGTGSEGNGTEGTEGTGSEGNGTEGANGMGGAAGIGEGDNGADGADDFDGSLCDDINDSTSSIPLTITGS
jgi:hypothetical protein